MRRIAIFFVVMLCCLGLTVPVLADSALSALSSDCVVTDDGSCTVVLSADLLLEEADPTLSFPLPSGAQNISLNGQETSATATPQATLVSLSPVTGGSAGQFHFTLRYTLPSVVYLEEESMELQLPMLSGFSYPMINYSFHITLPGQVEEEPVFTSGYYQEHIRSQMTLNVSGNTVSGSIKNLKDHESLQLRLPVDETMFPQNAANARTLGMIDLMIAIGMVLVLGYFLITMCRRPVGRNLRASAPDGICAGDLSLWYTGRGIDLSLMVVTWAQLGYLRIQVDDSGRVLLHKRMAMGNERSGFENKCFKLLFGRRRIVDGTGYHYATLCRSLRSKTPRIREIYRRRTGNPKILRLLATSVGLLSGITLAAGFSPNSIFLRVLLAIMTTLFSMVLHAGGSRVFLRRKLPLYLSIPVAGIWLLLGFLASEGVTACLMVVFQFLVGVGITWGGRRTELGHQALEQIISLRRHMRKVSKKDLQLMLKRNPGYFHQLAPYALAMDTDRAFARRFARLRLPECTYLVSGMRGQMTAAEWAKLLRTTVATLDRKATLLPLERMLGR